MKKQLAFILSLLLVLLLIPLGTWAEGPQQQSPAGTAENPIPAYVSWLNDNDGQYEVNGGGSNTLTKPVDINNLAVCFKLSNAQNGKDHITKLDSVTFVPNAGTDSDAATVNFIDGAKGYVKISSNEYKGGGTLLIKAGGTNNPKYYTVSVKFISPYVDFYATNDKTQPNIGSYEYDTNKQNNTFYLMPVSAAYIESVDINSGGNGTYAPADVDVQLVSTGTTTYAAITLKTAPSSANRVRLHYRARMENGEGVGSNININISSNIKTVTVQNVNYNNEEFEVNDWRNSRVNGTIDSTRVLAFSFGNESSGYQQVDSLTFEPDPQCDPEDVKANKFVYSDFFFVEYNDFCSGKLVATVKGTTVGAIQVSVGLPEVGMYKNDSIDKQNFIRSEFYVSGTDAVAYVGLQDGFEFTSEGAVTINQEYSSIDLTNVTIENVAGKPNFRKITVPASSITDEHTNINIHVRYRQKGSNGFYNDNGFSFNIIDTTKGGGMFTQYTGSLVTQSHHVVTDTDMAPGQFGDILTSDFGHGVTPFEYGGETYYLASATYSNKWSVLNGSSSSNGHGGSHIEIYSPWVFEKVSDSSGDSYNPVSSDFMDILRTVYDFSYNIYATNIVAPAGYEGYVPVSCVGSHTPYVYQMNTQASWAQNANVVKFDETTTGYWLIVSKAVPKGEGSTIYAVGSHEYTINETFELYVTSHDGAQISAQISQFLIDHPQMDKYSYLNVNLPYGIIHGNIVIPKEYEKTAGVAIAGNSWFNRTLFLTAIEGSVINNCPFPQIHVRNVYMQGAGKDNETFPGGDPNDGSYGPGQVVFSGCYITGYYHAQTAYDCVLWGGTNNTYEDNHVGLYPNLIERTDGGNLRMVGNIFRNNDIAIWLENINDMDLNIYTTVSTRFVNNGLDVMNRTGRLFWVSKNLFYHGPVNAQGKPSAAFSDTTRAMYKPVIYGTKNNVPMTLILPLAVNWDCTDFWYPQDMEGMAYILKWNNPAEKLQRAADDTISSSVPYLDQFERSSISAINSKCDKCGIFLSSNMDSIPLSALSSIWMIDPNGNLIAGWSGFGSGTITPISKPSGQ